MLTDGRLAPWQRMTLIHGRLHARPLPAFRKTLPPPDLLHLLPSAWLQEPKGSALIWRGDNVIGAAMWWGNSTVMRRLSSEDSVVMGRLMRWGVLWFNEELSCIGETLMWWVGPVRWWVNLWCNGRSSGVMGSPLVWRWSSGVALISSRKFCASSCVLHFRLGCL